MPLLLRTTKRRLTPPLLQVEKGSRPKLHGPPGKRHKKDNEDDDDDFSSADIKLILTDELKNVVVRDWENLTQKSFLLDLPKKPERTVNKIMSDFLAKKKDPVVMNQICQGLLVYFDRALPTILLYTVERAQYQKLREEFPLKRMCEIYGGEHLLRLFVRMPQLLTNTDLDETEIKQLITKLVELVKFLSKNASEYFSDDEGSGIYVPAAAASTTGSAAAATGAAAAKE